MVARILRPHHLAGAVKPGVQGALAKKRHTQIPLGHGKMKKSTTAGRRNVSAGCHGRIRTRQAPATSGQAYCACSALIQMLLLLRLCVEA